MRACLWQRQTRFNQIAVILLQISSQEIFRQNKKATRVLVSILA